MIDSTEDIHKLLHKYHFNSIEGKLCRRLNSHVLLIEDDLLQQKAELMILEDFGFSVTCVSSISEAIPYLLSLNTSKLVITDIELSGESGLDLVQILRYFDSEKKIPCVAISSEASRRCDALNVGCNAFLLKPLSKDSLSMTFLKFPNFNIYGKRNVTIEKI